MAENNIKNKFNALLDRLMSMAESVSEESYEEVTEAENKADVPEISEQAHDTEVKRDFFDFDKEDKPAEEEITRKIDSGEISHILDINIPETENNEKENTMIFKTPADETAEEENIHSEDVEETHIFGKLVSESTEEDDDLLDDYYEPRDFRPIRRNRHYRMGCMGGFMYFLVVVCISVALASVGWLAANDVLSLNKELVTAEITVQEDFTMEEIAQQLEDKGIIEYSFLFEIFSKLSTAEEKITPGTYTLSSHLDYRAIVTNLKEVEGPLKTVKVTIPEGKVLWD